MPLDRLTRMALTATLAFGMAGCAQVTDPGARGACGLEVNSRDAVGTGVILEPPYRTALLDAPLGNLDVPIYLRGSGWGTTHVEMAGPGTSVSRDMEADVMNAFSTWTATAPGTWHFKLSDGSCAREFDVDVQDAPLCGDCTPPRPGAS